MNLNRLIQLAAVGLLFSGAVSAEPILPPESRAVTITIKGTGPAVDPAIIRTVRQIVGHALASGTVDDFTVYSPKYGEPLPIEGGFSACAGAGYNASKSAFGLFISDLKTLKAKPGTFYQVQPVASCNADRFICTTDVRTCPDGSFVSRVPPYCAFAACPPK